MSSRSTLGWMVLLAAIAAPAPAGAGTCDCKSEISNASAEVSSKCTKNWVNNHCTLKETTTSGSATTSAEWSDAVRGRLGDQAAIEEFAFTAADDGLFNASAPRIDILVSAMFFTLNNIAPPEFVASTIELVRNSEGPIREAWSGLALRAFDGSDVKLVVGGRCISARSGQFDANFYMNFAPGNEDCIVATFFR